MEPHTKDVRTSNWKLLYLVVKRGGTYLEFLDVVERWAKYFSTPSLDVADRQAMHKRIIQFSLLSAPSFPRLHLLRNTHKPPQFHLMHNPILGINPS